MAVYNIPKAGGARAEIEFDAMPWAGLLLLPDTLP